MFGHVKGLHVGCTPFNQPDGKHLKIASALACPSAQVTEQLCPVVKLLHAAATLKSFPNGTPLVHLRGTHVGRAPSTFPDVLHVNM